MTDCEQDRLPLVSRTKTRSAGSDEGVHLAADVHLIGSRIRSGVRGQDQAVARLDAQAICHRDTLSRPLRPTDPVPRRDAPIRGVRRRTPRPE